MLEYVVVGIVALILLVNILKVVAGKMLVYGRRAIMRSLEIERGSRVITMIHRQNGKGLLAMLASKFIDIEDSMSILEAIRKTPDDKPIDFVVHTPGGLVLASAQIARALANHKGEVRIIVPHYAMSGGTLLALAADKIIMDENAVLGPVDPQIGKYPAASLMKIPEMKKLDEIDDDTLVLYDMAEKALNQMRNCVVDLLLSKGRTKEEAKDIAGQMVNGTWTHDYPLTCDYFKNLSFNVETEVPEKLYELMKLYPHIAESAPSVEYIPLPKSVPSNAKTKLE